MRKRFLGIDYGDKRVGLALAEDSGPALPFKIVQNKPNLLDELKKIAAQENIDVAVVGLPHSLSGQDNDRLRITRDFVNDLKNNLSISVDTVDEQMTSVMYEKMGVKKDLDKYSASAILDTYLSRINAS